MAQATSTRRTPLNAPDAAHYLGTTERHVRELVYRRQIPHFKVGRLVRFAPDDLDAWLDAHRVDTTA